MSLASRCRHVTFDAFATLFSPRRPVEQQYAEGAERYGILVDPSRLRKSFKQAFRATNEELPVYGKAVGKDPTHWWGQVILRSFTASGVDASALDRQMPRLVPALMRRFSSDEGYGLHDDALPCISALRSRGISIGVISNADPRVEPVLRSLGVCPDLIAPEAIVTSWAVGASKPDAKIWEATLRQERERRAKVASDEPELKPEEVLHVGDDVDEDYVGAERAGFRAALIRHPSAIAPAARADDDERLQSMRVITNLMELLDLPELRTMP